MIFRIREARDRIGITQGQLAEKLGIQVSTLSGYETGKHDPKSETLSLIAQICNTTTDYLLGRTDNPERNCDQQKSLPDDAIKLAKAYKDLDSYGKRVVNFIVEVEADRCKEDRKRREQEKKPRIMQMPRRFSMPIYNEPAAAGKPLDVGSDFEYLDFEEDTVPNGADFGVRIKGDSMGDSVPDGCIAFVRKAERAENGDIVIAWVDGEGTVCKRFIGEGDRLLYLKSDNESYPDITGDALIGLRIYGVVVGHTAQA